MPYSSIVYGLLTRLGWQKTMNIKRLCPSYMLKRCLVFQLYAN